MAPDRRNKYVCIHGHFYQPPRENPWTSDLEPQESAAPYRDWNERILQECYGPNAACPLSDARGRVYGMADNYSRMSFNFGPTLLSWLDRRRPELAGRIVDADRRSAGRRGGHGNAVAQPYVHAILPLETPRDRATMLRWGVEDFRWRFGRDPEGMWLPETAVDEATLEDLVAQKIRFAILAPHQAARVRPAGGGPWRDASADTFMPSRPYRWVSRLRPGLSLAIFFYYQELARAATEPASLRDGRILARKINALFLPDDSVQLVHLAADGEYFGHHRRSGAQALATAFEWLAREGVIATNYGEFLDLYPPPEEVEIRSNTAWSCPHGLGRWTGDCGCRHQKGTHQRWRGPLREALDWLRDGLDQVYETSARDLLRDPWGARDRYARRLLDPGAEDAFLSAESRRHLSPPEASRTLGLLEMQRHKLLMRTSCGWFFDDVGGIEAVQNLRHAARALELAGPGAGALAVQFQAQLARAVSNDAALENGAGVYSRLVLPLRADLRRAAADWALRRQIRGDAPLRPSPPRFSVEAGNVDRKSRALPAGRESGLLTASLRVQDRSTLESARFWAAVHQQDRLDLAAWVGSGEPPEGAAQGFDAWDPELARSKLEDLLGAPGFALDAVFPEERSELLRVLASGPPRSPRRMFLESWQAALEGLLAAASGRAGEPEGLMAALASCREQGLLPEELPGIGRLRGSLVALCETAAGAGRPADISRLARWIEVFEESGLHVPLWDLQDVVWRWRRRVGRGAAPELERETARAVGAKLGLSETMEDDHGDATR